MKTKECEDFDKVMDALMAVPYKELQEKLGEKQIKADKKKRSTSSTASDRASSNPNKRVA